uniref:Putative tick 18.3 kDa family protein n=1 Tax=Rhipicephalus pulchellus TaxID=72859 RepID=L7M9P9_RHIPC
MIIVTQIFAVALVLPCVCIAWHRYPSWSCKVVLHSNQRKTNCIYRCLSDNGQWKQGTHSDGTPCLDRRSPGRHAECIRGLCIVKEDTGPSFNTTHHPQVLPACDGQYHGKGYAPTCRYTCANHDGTRRTMTYLYGTPCLPIDQYGKRAGNAGICDRGRCIQYDELVSKFPTIEKKVHPAIYNRCPEKDHYGRNTLFSCYYYCKDKDWWFYGYYSSSVNSACELFRPDHRLGWCCKGSCITQPNCGQNVENSIPAQ